MRWWGLTRPTFMQIRSAALFAGGLAGVAYVTLADQTDRPTLLILFGAMLGLPLFLRSDEKHPPPELPVPQPAAPPVPPAVTGNEPPP